MLNEIRLDGMIAWFTIFPCLTSSIDSHKSVTDETIDRMMDTL